MAYVQIRDFAKSFGATRALDGVSLDIGRGEAHGLLGENGAGKSTLVKILSGIVAPDRGQTRVAGEDVPLGRPEAAARAGVATAFQELSLIPDLTVGENLLLPELPRGALGLVSRKRIRTGAAAILERFGLDAIDPGLPVSVLSLAQRQRLEIVNALSCEPRLLILDEPTAALPDTAWLFDHVRAATARGAAVLYISHRISEIRELCDAVTVLRNGEVAGRRTREAFDEDEAIRLMIGRPLGLAFPEKRAADAPAEPILSVRDLEVGSSVRGVSLDAGAGEVVGVSALEGQGQRELFYALAGEHHATAGTIELAGRPVRPSSPRAAQRTSVGIGLVPEDRKNEGLFLDMSARDNLAIPVLREVAVAGVLSTRRLRRVTDESAEATNIAPEYLDRPVSALSGGNQQKVVVARVMATGARCLLLFDPCRGVDVGTKLELYRLIRRVAANGGCVLVYSTEVSELVGLCDRIYVMFGGRVNGECGNSNLDEQSVMSLMMSTEPAGA